MKGENWKYNEGCLSIPQVMVNVSRKKTVKIRYYDENWNLKEEVCDRMLARVILHEVDHLNGILHIDYASPLKKKRINKTLKDIMEGKINTNYKMKFS